MDVNACYPGSFDPLTYGHLDIIRRATSLFGPLSVAIGVNVDKETLFTETERIAMIERALGDLASSVEVEVFEGLAVDHCRKRGVSILIRGVRTVSDFESEMAMAYTNRRIGPGIETVVLFPSEKHAFTSSRLIKEVVRGGGSVSEFVPPAVEQALARRLGDARAP